MSQIWGLLYYLFSVYHLLLEVWPGPASFAEDPDPTPETWSHFPPPSCPEARKITAMISSRQVLREDTHQ